MTEEQEEKMLKDIRKIEVYAFAIEDSLKKTVVKDINSIKQACWCVYSLLIMIVMVKYVLPSFFGEF